MENKDIPEVYYWNTVHGRAEFVQQFALLAGYPMKRVDIGFKEASLLAEKYNFYNLPTLKRGDDYISETLSIIHIMSEKKPELLGKTLVDKAKVLQIWGNCLDPIEAMSRAAYDKEAETKTPEVMKGIAPKPQNP